MRKFYWWFSSILKLAKLALAIPLATAGVLALLFLLQGEWYVWVLTPLVPLYIAADFFSTLDDLRNHWSQKKIKHEL